jgi:hypothetical protein
VEEGGWGLAEIALSLFVHIFTYFMVFYQSEKNSSILPESSNDFTARVLQGGD